MPHVKVPTRKPLVIAHRGESRDAPENTLAAIQRAWDLGAAAVEFDIRSTADGRIIVFHDADTRRICGIPGKVRMKNWSELRKLDAGRWKAPGWTGERIPLLSEVLKTMPRRGRVFVEIKDDADCVAAVARIVRRARIEATQVLIMSFDPAVVAAAARALPRCPIALIAATADWTASGGVGRLCRAAGQLGAGALNLEVHRRLNRAVIEQIHAAGLQVFCWTVNRVPTARRLVRSGIDGVTTDRCDAMRRALIPAVK